MFLCNRAEPRRLPQAAAPLVLPGNHSSLQQAPTSTGDLRGPFSFRSVFSIQNGILFDAKSSHRRNEGVWGHQFRRILSAQADLLFGT